MTRYFLASVFSILSIAASAQNSLRDAISQVTKDFHGDVGVALRHLEKGDTLSFNGERSYPMQSVYKFQLALAVLRQVDIGTLKLDQKLHVTKEDYFETYSPLMKKYPDANFDISLREVIEYNIIHSDNVACDLLFNLIGGPKKVDFYIHSIGIKEMTIQNTERELHVNNNLQFGNWSTPRAMANLLELFYKKKILQPKTHEFLWKTMVATAVSGKRIKGLLPAGTEVAHRSGTGHTDEKEFTEVVNNVGVITISKKNHVALVVFISHAEENIQKSEEVIARIAKVVFDYYSK